MIGEELKLDKIQFLVYTIKVGQQDVRCRSCGALLLRLLKFTNGHIQIKCQRCKEINDIKAL